MRSRLAKEDQRTAAIGGVPVAWVADAWRLLPLYQNNAHLLTGVLLLAVSAAVARRGARVQELCEILRLDDDACVSSSPPIGLVLVVVSKCGLCHQR